MNNNNNPNQEEGDRRKNKQEEEDDHQQDTIMPGFRFHPTEEELVEFYLRRKVEGKRFNVELITFLDLYRYDPWELPALAAIGEKEWYFYVPRDRKYRNGDRPNRVTTSGYWKATGADRMIRNESFRSIGLKKTLVFYTGKAPKGIRTCWIMNEYRLPQHETKSLEKAEISLCRVYKRPGVVEDHHSTTARSASSSSFSRKPQPLQMQLIEPAEEESLQIVAVGESSQQPPNKLSKITETSPSTSKNIGTPRALITHRSSYHMSPMIHSTPRQDQERIILSQSEQGAIFSSSSPRGIDDLHKIVNNYSRNPPMISQENMLQYPNQGGDVNNTLLSRDNNFSSLQQQQQANERLPHQQQNLGASPVTFSDRLWDWNVVSEASKDYNHLFK